MKLTIIEGTEEPGRQFTAFPAEQYFDVRPGLPKVRANDLAPCQPEQVPLHSAKTVLGRQVDALEPAGARR